MLRTVNLRLDLPKDLSIKTILFFQEMGQLFEIINRDYSVNLFMLKMLSYVVVLEDRECRINA